MFVGSISLLTRIVREKELETCRTVYPVAVDNENVWTETSVNLAVHFEIR